MDGIDLFRKLSMGAKFNLKRFRQDAERLKVIPLRTPTVVMDAVSPITEENEGKRKASDNAQSALHKKVKQDEPLKNASATSESDTDTGSEKVEDIDLLDTSSDPGETSEINLLGNMKSESTVALRHTCKKKRAVEQNALAKRAQIKQEEINHFRNHNKIHVHGTDIPAPVGSFDELHAQYGLNEKILANLMKYGYTTPTPIQMQAVPAMMCRRDVLACAPTGSGKTAAFILPILHHLKGPQKKGFRALVLAPTRELAKQTYLEFSRIAEGLGFQIHLIEKSSSAIKKFGAKSSKKFDILVTTPNRLVHLLSQDGDSIQLGAVEWLVVDESDKLFEEGRTGFRDQLATVYKACDSSCVRRAMFSATFAHAVEEWCRLHLDNLVEVYIGAKNAATASVVQELKFVGSEQGKLVGMRDLVRAGLDPPVLVFVQSKERAKELFHELVYDGINVDVLHADLTQTQRETCVLRLREGRIWVLVCTELVGRGLDFKGVNLVVNYDLPTSAITYIHRIGRTGRAGRQGRAITFFTEDDMANLRGIANVMKQAGCPVPDYMLHMARPGKKARRKLATSEVKRRTIRTMPLSEIKQARRKRKNMREQQNAKAVKSSVIHGHLNSYNVDEKSSDGRSMDVNKKNNKHKVSKLQKTVPSNTMSERNDKLQIKARYKPAKKKKVMDVTP